MTYWQKTFAAMAPNYNPRHIEAYVRLECSILDNLSDARLRKEVKMAQQCIDIGGLDQAESLAKSYGL